MLIEKFASQFNVLIIVEFIVFSIGVMLLSRSLFQHTIKSWIRPDAFSILSKIDDTLKTTFLVIIAFAMSESITNYHAIATIVGTEASQLNNLNQLLSSRQIKNSDEIKKGLLIYVQSIINDEWPELYLGRRNEKTQKISENLSKLVKNIDPSNDQESIYSDITKLISSINESRESRIASASLKIPGIFWLAIVILFVARSFLFTCHHDNNQEIFGMSFETALLAALTAITFILDSSYASSTRIGPQSFESIVQLINSHN